MSKQDEIASINKKHWEKMVKQGCDLTHPWLNLDRDLVHKYAKGQLVSIPEPLVDMYPASVLANVEGKDVLCLASGGGQQSAVFSLLGARVTVLDLVEGQLQGDRRAAENYGYKVTTVRADMRDISCINDESFDLVYQASSMAYVPNVHEVYSGVVRVLRVGGIYRVNFTNPAIEFVDCEDWDGEGYRICRPYTEKIRRRNDGAIEFRHYLRDIFNGLLAVGFSIRQVEDNNPLDTRADPKAKPGSWRHYLSYIVGFTIVAVKERNTF